MIPENKVFTTCTVVESNQANAVAALTRLAGKPKNTILIIRCGGLDPSYGRTYETTLRNLQSDLYPLSHADQIAAIESDLFSSACTDLPQLMKEVSLNEKTVLGLIARKAPPDAERRFDGHGQSFICTGSMWHEVIQQQVGNFEDLCFALFSALLNGETCAKVVSIRQLPLKISSSYKRKIEIYPAIATIIPHRHSLTYLNIALDYATKMTWPSPVRMAVGLDVDNIKPYLTLSTGSAVDLYISSIVPSGPYVFRQSMIENSAESIFLYLDSDDLPCSDRIEKLYEGLQTTGADMIGCHEFEVNEIDHTVRIYRFPIDVSSVLDHADSSGVSDDAIEPILHATSMVRRQAFLSAGGLSTNRRIANDSQFLLRASFSMSIRNVDEFLYIRRVHKAALTKAKETHNGNALRKELSSLWGSDFKAIKRGILQLEHSSLIAQGLIKPPTVNRLKEEDLV